MSNQPALPRIYLDFNWGGSPVPLDCWGSVRDITCQGLQLYDGMRAHFYEEDEDGDGVRGCLFVEGVVRWDASENRWMAEVDWDAIRFVAGPTMGPI